jgi:outer membrane murein-binding lipoprotein Lpp
MRRNRRARTSQMKEIVNLVSEDMMRLIILILIIFVTAFTVLARTAETVRDALEGQYSEAKQRSNDFEEQVGELGEKLEELEGTVETTQGEKQKAEKILTQVRNQLQTLQQHYQEEVDQNQNLRGTLQRANRQTAALETAKGDLLAEKARLSQIVDELRSQVVSLETDNSTLRTDVEKLSTDVAQLRSDADVQKYETLRQEYEVLQNDYASANEELQTLASSKRNLVLIQVEAIPFETLEVAIEVRDIADSERKEKKIQEIANALIQEIGVPTLEKETRVAIEAHARNLFNTQAGQILTEHKALEKREQELLTLDRLARERKAEIIESADADSFTFRRPGRETKRIEESIRRLIPHVATWDEENQKRIGLVAKDIYNELRQRHYDRLEKIKRENDEIFEVASPIFQRRRDTDYRRIQLNSTVEVRATIVKDVAVQIRKALEKRVKLGSFEPESISTINPQAEGYYDGILNQKRQRKAGVLDRIGLITPGDVRERFPEKQIPTSGSEEEATQRIYLEILAIAEIGEGDADFDSEIKQAAMKRADDVYTATIAAESLGAALEVDWIIVSKETTTHYGPAHRGHIIIKNWDLSENDKTFDFQFGSPNTVKKSMEEIQTKINQQIVHLLYSGMKTGRKIEFKVHSRVIGMLIPQYVAYSIEEILTKLEEQEKGHVTFNLTQEFHPEER